MKYKKGANDFAEAFGIKEKDRDRYYEVVEKALLGSNSIDDIIANLAPEMTTPENACFLSLTAISILEGIKGEMQIVSQ